MIITNDINVRKMDEQITGDRFGKDHEEVESNRSKACIPIHNSCIVNEIKHKSFAETNNVNELLKMCSVNENKQTLNEKNENVAFVNNALNTNVIWPIERNESPVTEWKNNREIVYRAFPYLFLCGCKVLPMSTFSPKFIKHLMLYYDGRFEKFPLFISFLFNQLQRHSAIRKISRLETSSKKNLNKNRKITKK